MGALVWRRMAAAPAPAARAALAAGGGRGKPPTKPPVVDPAAKLRETEAAMAELRRQLAEKEAAVRAKQAEKAAKQAADHARKAALQAEAEQRRAALARGLAALAEAAAPEGEGGAERGAGGAAPREAVRLASLEDVRRVLQAASDYEVLQLPVGSTAVEVRRAYRRLAASLHPDKCREEGAQQAFIRATSAYNALLRRSGG
ncbi:hypothetical protein GPECTOR_61g851 [Gonium pectorale]|uniref:J domain-containing protein n=1 Tax=Gonium pectorale TaxID=33097 RepID=A0A150G4Z8_GONPE|nr:hypothetical protein GPECTOR_61g851 [Gonium pectorale]|eukprot:KXZ44898.1 hypothetical protein GPECTOR_61g851 [Gonium pectorale]